MHAFIVSDEAPTENKDAITNEHSVYNRDQFEEDHLILNRKHNLQRPVRGAYFSLPTL